MHGQPSRMLGTFKPLLPSPSNAVDLQCRMNIFAIQFNMWSALSTNLPALRSQHPTHKPSLHTAMSKPFFHQWWLPPQLVVHQPAGLQVQKRLSGPNAQTETLPQVYTSTPQQSPQTVGALPTIIPPMLGACLFTSILFDPVAQHSLHPLMHHCNRAAGHQQHCRKAETKAVLSTYVLTTKTQ